jgi:hypothetical protein
MSRKKTGSKAIAKRERDWQKAAKAAKAARD